MPANTTRPWAILPGGSWMSREIESAVTLLPQPDSPTRPKVSPASTAKETWLTAWSIGRGLIASSEASGRRSA